MEKKELSSMTLKQLLSLRERIEAVIEQKREEQRAEAIARIKNIAHEAGISLNELVGKRGRRAVVRYRDPDDPANTWTGRGRRPKWLQAALENGRDPADFAV